MVWWADPGAGSYDGRVITATTSDQQTGSVERGQRSIPAWAYPAALGIVVFVVIFALGFLVLGLFALLPAIVLGALAGFALWSRADGLVLASTGATPADALTHARLLNVTEGLGAASGVADPDLYVIDDSAMNALAFGRRPRQGALVVTTGLLAGLDRMELEAVVAHLICLLKSDATAGATMAAVTRVGRPPVGELGGAVHVRADREAVALTRYPPAMVSVLEKLQAANTVIERDASATAHLWLVNPLADDAASHHQPLDQRVAYLREL